MSEYQYWEFQALDQRLSDADMKYVNGLSSRVDLSPSRAAFEYNYSSLHADEEALLTRCFDAMFYIANWGSRRLMFRLPLASVDRAALERFDFGEEYDSYGSITFTRDYVIVDIYINDEDLRGWIETGAGALDRMVALREDLLRGDYRMLYLAWLKIAGEGTGVYYDKVLWKRLADQTDDTVPDDVYQETADALLMREPPVPPGLGSLSPALKYFVECFNIDPDLVAAAAASSAGAPQPPRDLEPYIAELPDEVRNGFLARVLRGEPRVDLELRALLRSMAQDKQQSPAPAQAQGGRTIFTLLRAAEVVEQQRKAEKRAQAEAKRLERLEAVSQKVPEAWARVETLIAQQKGKAYEEAVDLLKQLRELAQHQGNTGDFEQRLEGVKAQLSPSSAMHRRLRNAGM